jgi:hypothetical protein
VTKRNFRLASVDRHRDPSDYDDADASKPIWLASLRHNKEQESHKNILAISELKGFDGLASDDNQD